MIRIKFNNKIVIFKKNLSKFNKKINKELNFSKYKKRIQNYNKDLKKIKNNINKYYIKKNQKIKECKENICQNKNYNKEKISDKKTF